MTDTARAARLAEIAEIREGNDQGLTISQRQIAFLLAELDTTERELNNVKIGRAIDVAELDAAEQQRDGYSERYTAALEAMEKAEAKLAQFKPMTQDEAENKARVSIGLYLNGGIVIHETGVGYFDGYMRSLRDLGLIKDTAKGERDG